MATTDKDMTSDEEGKAQRQWLSSLVIHNINLDLEAGKYAKAGGDSEAEHRLKRDYNTVKSYVNDADPDISRLATKVLMKFKDFRNNLHI